MIGFFKPYCFQRYVQHHPAAVTHDPGGDVNDLAAQAGDVANLIDHWRARVLL
jgi:hypothetical protein